MRYEDRVNAGSGSRALVAPEQADSRPGPAPQPRATFVMQMIACAGRLEAYRVRGRIAADEAPEHYRGPRNRLKPALVDLDL